ncbi:gonadotropin-releasing hormone receptor isoform X2 [Cryptotermes secundus]|nr:gonadotropin-releasing hormone receptor isoform X2 [Cryptotermes secundus]XP_023723729.1 gonadotropin-releasing hormone receptor isoform X2 [Cryptotermes secundus]XP_023723738.1 gonadotropin-releasing hormone receptor isoform X2 [Cryptotermes secundus]XP_033610958.1 gonadotropin-releasing hormone receptor isoform X2 [Cryptotermes secundus]XP_033610960.1 gonadotropin-releasing hormone receptor isoform X2 [Cryptotermes secundus]
MATPTTGLPPTTEFLSDDMKFNDGHRMSIITYSVLMAVSAVGNITVLVNILRRRRSLRFGNNYMFMHLAIADLLVTFLMMPLEIAWNTTVSWRAGDAVCRIMSFFRTFGLYLSSFVIVSISLDRCFAILRPMANVVNVAKRGKMMLTVAWSLATLCSTPQMVIFHVERHPNVTWYEQCVAFNMFPTKLHELTYRVLGMAMMYGLPLVVIIISYACIIAEIFRRYQLSQDDSFRRSSLVFLTRARTRTLKMAIIIFVVFFICWTPYYVMCLWYWIDEASAGAVDQRVQKGLFLFACTNSCMNPIVYGYFNFRSRRGSGHGAPRRRADQQHQNVMPLNAAALSVSTTGANSRRGSNCSSIYRSNSNQNMCKNLYRPVPMAHRNNKGPDHPIARSNTQTTSFRTTANTP